jgi:TonB family protein
LYFLILLAAMAQDKPVAKETPPEKIEQTQVKEDELLADEPAPAPFLLPPPTDGSTLPIPKANPGLWISTEDYPTLALAEKRSGTTSFRIEVDKSGAVSSCTVIVSSGHKDLDDATCEYVSKRALFDPATDKRGRKVTGVYQNRVSWRIPNSIDLPKTGQFTMVFEVDAEGNVTSCKYDTTMELAPGYDACSQKPTFDPRKDANGNPIAVRVVTSTVTKIYKLPTKTD